MDVSIVTVAPSLSSITQTVTRDVIIYNETSSMSEGDNVTDILTVPDGCVVFPLSRLLLWDNPEDLVSREMQETSGYVLNAYLLPLSFLLSTPLNIVNMVVFWRQGIKERINFCLFFLGLADFIIVAGHFEWLIDYLYAAVTKTPYQPVLAKVSINNMIHSLAGFIYISGFMTTLIAFERCLCVVNPLKAQSIISLKTTAVIVAVAHVVIFIVHYMIATKWKIVCLFDPATHLSVDTFYPSQFYLKNKAIIDVLDSIVLGILLPGFYVIGISTCTFVMILRLRQMKVWRDKASSAEATSGSASKDNTVTRMLIATNVLFVVCTTPPLVFHTLLPFFPELGLGGKYQNTFAFLVHVQQLLTYINSSVNFFFYYFFGTKFRQTVQHLCCALCVKKGL